MSSFTPLDTNGLLPGEAWTSGKALAVYGNAIAIAEGGTDAPRVSPKAQGVKPISGGAAGTLTLSGFGDYDGSTIGVKFSNIAPGTVTMTADLSSNGSTFETAFDIAEVSGNETGAVSIFIDLETGVYVSIWKNGSDAGIFSGTATLPAGDTTHIRLVAAGTSTTSLYAIAMPNAGTVS